jgi:hypothetical protein
LEAGSACKEVLIVCERGCYVNDDCLSRIENSAYLFLSIQCEKCNEDFEITAEISEPIEEWAKAAANLAITSGWSCGNNGMVLCANCKASEGRAK